MLQNEHEAGIPRLSTGITGLDEILHGGFIPGRAYLVRGGPGVGKTMLGLSFLAAGVAAGDQPLYLTLEETEQQIREDARSVGLDLQGITVLDLSPSSEFFTKTESYDIFAPAEVDREPTTNKIVEAVDRLRPKRVYLEAMTQFRYLTPDSFQFHKQVLSFLRFLTEKGATVLFSSEASETAPDDDLQFVSDGVIQLAYAPGGRTIAVTKFRGSDFRGGEHTVRIDRGGMLIFPKLVSEDHQRPFHPELIRSGVPELDEMLHGGMTRGMVTLISGPSGVGKTTVGVQFMKEQAGRGDHSAVYLFEEWRESFIHRCEAISIPVQAMIDRGTLSVIPVEPLRYSSDEFNRMVRREVEERNARIVMLDSISGYRMCIRSGDVVGHIAALTRYLKNMGVTGLLINETEAISGGDFRVTEIGISYMADNILFLRYLEVNGELRKAIGVLKKRMSSFQNTMRELEITRYGLKVGKPLTNLRGILIGTPQLVEPPEAPPSNGRRNYVHEA
jgi:circadian clock protein KaiC